VQSAEEGHAVHVQNIALKSKANIINMTKAKAHIPNIRAFLWSAPLAMAMFAITVMSKKVVFWVKKHITARNVGRNLHKQVL